jgi:hypothetical protein
MRMRSWPDTGPRARCSGRAWSLSEIEFGERKINNLPKCSGAQVIDSSFEKSYLRQTPMPGHSDVMDAGLGCITNRILPHRWHLHPDEIVKLMAGRRVDAPIIGAGAAGLAAAREIPAGGLTATVIEA